jgi:hypothetical protein
VVEQRTTDLDGVRDDPTLTQLLVATEAAFWQKVYYWGLREYPPSRGCAGRNVRPEAIDRVEAGSSDSWQTFS